MNRRLLVSLAVVTASASALSLPAVAGKPKPIKGSYTLTLLPDPTNDVFHVAGVGACAGVNPASINKHAFVVPGPGTLVVHLSSPNPASAAPAGFDWDLYTTDADGQLSGSNSPGAEEETVDSFKKKTPITIKVCNLGGEPSGTVTYTFTSK